VNYIKLYGDNPSFKIQPVKEYPNLEETLNLAHVELDNNARPEIKDPLKNINEYDTILLGYPLWHKHLPCIVMNQLEQLNFRGKTIYPFNTYGSSGIAESVNDIKKLCPDAKVKEGFSIKDSTSKIKDESVKIIKEWIYDIFRDSDNINDRKDTQSVYNNNSFFIKMNLLLILLVILI
jgi:flavodoxin